MVIVVKKTLPGQRPEGTPNIHPASQLDGKNYFSSRASCMHIDGNTSKSINNRKDTNMETKATGRPTYKYKVTPMIRTNKGSLNQV